MRDRIRMRLFWLAPLCVFLLVLSFPLGCVTAQENLEYVYLNSHKHCGHDISLPVNKNLMYKIRADISPKTKTSAFIECEMTFHSEDEDGRLCLSEDGHKTEIHDNNVQLIAKDGVGNAEDHTMFTVEYYPKVWHRGEQCTSSRYLHLLLRKEDKHLPADIRKVFVFIKVMDIRSHNRRAYMTDLLFCGNTYPLYRSSVSVYNRPRVKNSAREKGKELNFKCGMTFTKEPASANRSLCLVVSPRGPPDCSNNWRLLVTLKRGSLDPKDIAYSIDCKDPRANQMHAWCAANTTNMIVLAWLRGPGIWSNQTLPERPEMQHLILTDYPGGNTGQLLRKVGRDLNDRNGGNRSGFELNMWWVMIILAAGMFAFIVAALVYRNRKSMCGRRRRGSSDRRTSHIEVDHASDEDDV